MNDLITTTEVLDKLNANHVVEVQVPNDCNRAGRPSFIPREVLQVHKLQPTLSYPDLWVVGFGGWQFYLTPGNYKWTAVGERSA